MRAALEHGLVAHAQVLLQVLGVESARGEEVEVRGFGGVEQLEGLDHVDEHSLLLLHRVGSFHLGHQIEALADEEERRQLVLAERRVLLRLVQLELDVLYLGRPVLQLLRHRGGRRLRLRLFRCWLLDYHLFAVARTLRLLGALLHRLGGLARSLLLLDRWLWQLVVFRLVSHFLGPFEEVVKVFLHAGSVIGGKYYLCWAQIRSIKFPPRIFWRTA